MLGWLRSIAESIGSLASNIGTSITDGIKAIFIPDADYVELKFNDLKNRFTFAYSIIETIQVMEVQFGTAMTADNPPQIKIDLGKANSKYDWGSECYVLDMSWYEPYKPMVDNVLSMIMWAFFIWRLFVALPNIINGISGTAQDNGMYEIKDGHIGLSAKGKARRSK